MDIYLNSRLVLIATFLGFITIAAIFIIKTIIDRGREKKLEKTIKEWDAKIQQQWNKRDEEAARIKAEAAKKIAAEAEAESKKKAETLIVLETNYADFFKSPEYKFIERFAGKYAAETNVQELSKLQSLLRTQQWDFSSYELELLVARELKRQKGEVLKSKILGDGHKERDEIIKAYLNNFVAEDEQMLVILAEILREENLFDGNLTDLKTELTKTADKIELEKFASLLLNDNDTPIRN